jgi:hypothetical protein
MTRDMMMSLRDFESGYKASHCVIHRRLCNQIVFSSLVARERVPSLLVTPKRYLVPAEFGGIWGNQLRSIVFSLSNFLSQIMWRVFYRNLLCGNHHLSG